MDPVDRIGHPAALCPRKGTAKMPASRTVLLVTALAALACGKGSSQGPADSGKICKTLSDCGGEEICLDKICVAVCHATSECGSGQVCEDGHASCPPAAAMRSAPAQGRRASAGRARRPPRPAKSRPAM